MRRWDHPHAAEIVPTVRIVPLVESANFKKMTYHYGFEAPTQT